MKRTKYRLAGICLSSAVLLTLATSTAGAEAGRDAGTPVSSAGGLFSIDAGDAEVRLVKEEVSASGVIAVSWLVDGEQVGFASTEPVDVEVVREESEKDGSIKVVLHSRESGADSRQRTKAEELQMMTDLVTMAGLPQSQIDYWVNHVEEGQKSRPDVVIGADPRPTYRDPGEIVQAKCATTGDMNAGQKYAQVCSTQKYIATANGYSYAGDEGVGTARYNHTFMDLEGFTGATAYPAGRERTHWSPNSTIPIEGSCQDKTFSIGYKGVGISASTSACEEKLVPEPATGKMAVRWAGDANDPVGIAYTQVIKKKVGTSNNYDVTLWAYHAA